MSGAAAVIGRRAEIRIFRADPMKHTMFSERKTDPMLARAGIGFVSVPESADIILARRPQDLRPYGYLDRRFAVWTNEPRYALTRNTVDHVNGIGNPVHSMTAHNGTIYQDCFFYGPHRAIDLDERMQTFRSKPRRAIMLATYRSHNKGIGGWPLIVDGWDIDLFGKRQEIGLALQARGACDLFGKYWPADVMIGGQSRDGDWRKAKAELLSAYGINIALENTIIPYYVTEKLWDAIAGATLPVYHGTGNMIYELFQPESFIEASGKDAETLSDEIISMPDDERTDRYEECVRGYQRAIENKTPSRESCRERTIQFLWRLMD